MVTVVRVLLETSAQKGEKSVKSGIIPILESAPPTWQEHGIPLSGEEGKVSQQPQQTLQSG